MYLVGLGNPGAEYRNTRHNMGFILIDRMVGEKEKPKKVCRSLFYKGRGQISGFVKPQTYMNLSGRALKCLRELKEISARDFIICYDDVDLPFGELRIRDRGGSGGHKGIKSILENLEDDRFIRLRIGISNDEGKETRDYVLDEFTGEEAERLPEIMKTAQRAVLTIVRRGVTVAQNMFNRRLNA